KRYIQSLNFAVKTLREGHSNEDKIKFIKEAILMK
uniref:Uncharacterized protein n=1 Tax=Panagrolaimus sp. JU765 TaxID=591449 RepID=A0AC34RH88_9BILA